MSWLTRNWQLKLAALGLATALWAFVMTSEKAELVVVAPVELEGTPPGLEVVGERPDNVDVQLHGLRTTLARLPTNQVRARVSLQGAREGESDLRIMPEEVIVPPGVTVIRISPARLRVVLEASRSARLTVVPRLTGSPAAGYRVAAVRAIPPEVAIEGPASRIKGLAKMIETEPVDLGGATAAIERVANLVGPSDAVRLPGGRTVRVVVEVVKENAGAGGAVTTRGGA